MQILGITLRRPTYREVTRTTLIATVVLVVIAVVAPAAGFYPSRFTAVVLFATSLWGMIGNLMGISVRAGWRHLLLNVSGSVVLAIVISLAWTLFD